MSIVPKDITDEWLAKAYESGMDHLGSLCVPRINLFYQDCSHGPEEWELCLDLGCSHNGLLAADAMFRKFQGKADRLIRDSFHSEGDGYFGSRSCFINAAKMAVDTLNVEINSSPVRDYEITVVERDGKCLIELGSFFYPLETDKYVEDQTDNPMRSDIGIVRKDEHGYYRLVAECDCWSERCQLVGHEHTHDMSSKEVGSDWICEACLSEASS